MTNQRSEELCGELSEQEEELLAAFQLMPEEKKERLLRVAQHVAKHNSEISEDQIRELFNNGIQ